MIFCREEIFKKKKVWRREGRVIGLQTKTIWDSNSRDGYSPSSPHEKLLSESPALNMRGIPSRPFSSTELLTSPDTGQRVANPDPAGQRRRLGEKQLEARRDYGVQGRGEPTTQFGTLLHGKVEASICYCAQAGGGAASSLAGRPTLPHSRGRVHRADPIEVRIKTLPEEKRIVSVKREKLPGNSRWRKVLARHPSLLPMEEPTPATRSSSRSWVKVDDVGTRGAIQEGNSTPQTLRAFARPSCQGRGGRRGVLPTAICCSVEVDACDYYY